MGAEEQQQLQKEHAVEMCCISVSVAVQVVSVMLVHLARIVIPVTLAAVVAREEDLQVHHARLSLRIV